MRLTYTFDGFSPLSRQTILLKGFFFLPCWNCTLINKTYMSAADKISKMESSILMFGKMNF